MRRRAPPIGPIQAGLGHRADRRPDRLGKRDHCFAGTGLGKPNHDLAGGDDLSRLAKRFNYRSIRVRHQHGIGRLVLGELRLGGIRCGFRLVIALSGDPSFVEQMGVSLFVRLQLNDRCASRGNGVALGREGKAKVRLVDPHQRLAGSDLLTDIHKPFHDLAGDAKAEIALDPRPYDAREAAFGSGRPHCRRQSDNRSFLPRVAHGRGFLRAKGNRGECGRP
jgi:hypothetical protein